MNKVLVLVNEVGIVSEKYILNIKHLTQEKATYKIAEDVWNVVEITEHLFWA